MLNLKKTAVAVLALGSSAVFAGTMGPVCTPGNVTVPCENAGWDIGIQALYLKSTFTGDLAYAGTITTPTGTATSYQDVDPGYDWGFRLEGSYHYGTGSDVNLNWTHYNTSNDNNLSGNFLITAFSGAIETGSVEVEPRWDAVNLEFGQWVDYGDFTNVRFHAGAQYARIRNENQVNATDSLTFTDYAQWNTNYNGFGPRIGVDASYDLANGFSVYGKGATALLAGTSKFNTYESLTTPAGVVLSTTSFSGSRTSIVPELEGKLGATYTFGMAQGNLSVDAGWMWVDYINVLHIATLDDSDFGVTGPYVGLKWVGNV